MFEEFWQLYPRKVAKKDARKMWARLSESQKTIALQALPLHVKVWNAEGREPHQIPHAATWINGERFEDELEMPGPRVNGQNVIELGRRYGLEAKPGESTEQFTRRVMAARH